VVTVTIDGRRAKVEPGTTILEAATRLGIDIPALCSHPALEPYAACRLCLVDVRRNGKRQLVTSCNTSVDQGMIISTRTRQVRSARRMNLELLLARAPAAKIVRSLAARHGIRRTRFPSQDREEDCILCGLCVRVCEVVVGQSAICFSHRGAQRRLSTPFDKPSDACIACGACAYLCPTQAVQMERETVQRFRELRGPLRQCRYSLMGLLPYALCANSFRCATCEVEQRFRDSIQTHPIFVARHCQMEAVSLYDEFLKRLRG